MSLNFSNNNERLNFFRRINDKFRNMSGREPTSLRSTSGSFYKRSKSFRPNISFGSMKNYGMIIGVIVFAMLILRFLYSKTTKLRHMIKCAKSTGDFIGCIESKPFNCKKIKKRLYGYCADNNDFMLGTKRGPIEKSDKCVKWIWNSKNCPLDFKKEKESEFKQVKKSRRSKSKSKKRSKKDKPTSLLPIAGVPQEMEDLTDEASLRNYEEVDTCVQKDFCGKLNGKDISCPPKFCADKDICKCSA